MFEASICVVAYVAVDEQVPYFPRLGSKPGKKNIHTCNHGLARARAVVLAGFVLFCFVLVWFPLWFPFFFTERFRVINAESTVAQQATA